MLNWADKKDDEIADFVVKQDSRLIRRRQIYEPLFSLIIKVFKPRHRSLLKNDKAGQSYGQKIYSANPALTIIKFSRSAFGHMASRGVNDPWWLRFTTAHQDMMENDRIKQALQESQEQVRYGFNQSNFYEIGPNILSNAASIGTAVALTKENKVKDCITFEVQHPRKNYIATNQFGDVDIYHRPIKLTAKTAVEMFGKDVFGADHELVKNAEGKNPFAEYEFIHAVYVNGEYKENGYDTLDKPYIKLYVMLSGRKGAKKHALIEKKGDDYFPIVLRFGVEEDSEYGISPAADALTCALICNKLSHKHLMAVHAMVEPPILAHDSLRECLHPNPGGKTFTDDMTTKKAEFMLNNVNWQPSEYEMKKIDDQVGEFFGLRLFEMLTSAEFEMTNVTAYQIRQMIAEKLPQIVPILEACEDNLLEPASNIIWIDETRKNRMPPLPPELFEDITGRYKRSRRIINEYFGKAAKLRRSIDEMNATDESIIRLKAIAEIYPSALLKIKELQFVERALITAGIPQKDLRGDDEVQELIEQQMADEQQARDVETIERLSKVIPSISKDVGPKSPAAMIAGAA